MEILKILYESNKSLQKDSFSMEKEFSTEKMKFPMELK